MEIHNRMRTLMIFRMFTLLLIVSTLHFQNPLMANCGGCSRGQGLVSEATSSAATAGLPGLAGAAGLPGLAGVPGVPGPAGPQGSPGLPGGLLDYGMVFALSQGLPAPNVSGSQKILWNEGNDQFAPGSTFTHVAGSTDVVINSVGTYIARYIASVDSGNVVNPAAVPTAFAIFFGNSLLPGSDRSTSIANAANTQLNVAGEVIFRVDASQVGLAVTVQNLGANTNIGTYLPAHTAASLFIQKISSN